MTRPVIPADIQKAAAAVYAQLGRGPDADEQTIAKALMAAVAAEKSRIVEGLEQEADVTPCHEDAVGVADCAVLVLADFSYDEAEKIEVAREAAAITIIATPAT